MHKFRILRGVGFSTPLFHDQKPLPALHEHDPRPGEKKSRFRAFYILIRFAFNPIILMGKKAATFAALEPVGLLQWKMAGFRFA
jgi:hypothetical protein